MSFRLRAVRALVLLAGFHLMSVVLLGAMGVFDWLLVTRMSTERAAWFEGMVLTVTVLLAVAILRGMSVSLRAGRLGPVPNAVAVTPEEQPELWEQVRAAAEVTGERPPDELYLVAEVNAAVAEQTRLLGLLPGRRRMLLGVPLLAGPSARNFIRPKVFDGLAGLVHLHLAAAGHAAPDIAWSGRPGVVFPEAWEEHMDDAVDAAVGDAPDTAPLRALLAGTRPLPA
ncbi:M48 family metallopeptidase [Kitasatospora sp. KL5]|uniref:M48 family metallopeptidase n=1 Tax=Kitasatospora sp. KL5 TaxID=3425125 RepID=UPI003D6F5E78